MPLAIPAKFPIPTQNAARVFWWLDAEDSARAVGWARCCLRALFANGCDLSDAAVIAAGVFGAPFFMVDGRTCWGNDRRPQIERWLALPFAPTLAHVFNHGIHQLERVCVVLTTPGRATPEIDLAYLLQSRSRDAAS